MALCGLCSNIAFHLIPPYPDVFKQIGSISLGPGLYFFEPHIWGYARPDIFGLPHHHDLNSLAGSAQACALCSLIYEQVQELLGRIRHGQRRPDNGPAYPDAEPRRYSLQITRRDDQEGFVVWTDDGPGQRVWYIAIFAFGVDQGKQISIGVDQGKQISTYLRHIYARLNLWRKGTDPLAGIFKGRLIEEDPSLPKSQDLAFEWVNNCNNHHNCAPPPPGSPFPTRLLDVGESSSSPIKLWETGGARGYYMTLSYVWGKTKQLTTTTKNYATHQQGIPPDVFPKTMQDAFIVTRRMGIRHIWIDALCIVQNDVQDWEREAAQMESVYANSYLTISAAGSTDNSDGCFIRRPVPNHATFDYAAGILARGKLTIFPQPLDTGIDFEEVVSMRGEPISNRGWCFQERVVSRRTLFYARHQMHFECKTEFLSESGAGMRGRFLDIDDPTNAVSRVRAGSMRELWDLLVQDYSLRALTKGTDRLPAMSGLAARFERALGDRYLAGLWESTLFGDLLWTGTNDAPWPPAEHRAPSWSWAAVNGSQRAFERYRHTDGVQFTRIARIISCSVRVSGSNPYGEVDEGRVVIQAPVLRIRPVRDIATDPDGLRERAGLFGFVIGADEHLHWGSVHYMIGLDTLQTLELHVVVMGRDNFVSQYPCLIVVPHRRPSGQPTGDYRRIGFLRLSDAEFGSNYWSEGREPNTIMLT